MKNETKGKIFLSLAFMAIMIVLTTALFYWFLWVDKANCEAMGGAYSIENNFILTTSNCIVSTLDVTTICTRDGVRVDCNDTRTAII